MAEEKFPEFRTCACDMGHGRIVGADGVAEIEVCTIGMARKSLKAAVSEGRVAPRHASRLLEQIQKSGLPRDYDKVPADMLNEVCAWNSQREPHDWLHPPCFTEACAERHG